MKVHLIEYIATMGAAPPYFPYYEKPLKPPVSIEDIGVYPLGSPAYTTKIKTIKYRYDKTEYSGGLYYHRYVAAYEGEPPDDYDEEDHEEEDHAEEEGGEEEDKEGEEEDKETAEKILKEKMEEIKKWYMALGDLHQYIPHRAITQYLSNPIHKNPYEKYKPISRKERIHKRKERIHKSFEEMLEEQELEEQEEQDD